MGDSSKFQSIIQYYLFNSSFLLLLLMEVWIFIKTFRTSNSSKKRDRGTRWLLTSCFVSCIVLSTYMVSKSVPRQIHCLVLPEWTAWIGIILIMFGIILRIVAVKTLKKSFTLNVQTTNSQQLITNGVFHLLRNPAYTGSIASLLGVAISFRSLIAIPIVLFINILCYVPRIYTEEIALYERFGEKFTQYKKNTWRLFPYVW